MMAYSHPNLEQRLCQKVTENLLMVVPSSSELPSKSTLLGVHVRPILFLLNCISLLKGLHW